MATYGVLEKEHQLKGLAKENAVLPFFLSIFCKKIGKTAFLLFDKNKIICYNIYRK